MKVFNFANIECEENEFENKFMIMGEKSNSIKEDFLYF